ncbi:PREDICTED: LOW QUALITY PROTEIN: odorant receptor 10a [Drosophila arizonae]|uniref:Odorant receptor n=1 Tax=Drosophila arizonae TaxID=7263 RepID=A0ABM1PQU1_DROAR|nr:PREDICTED: LOW QUALITY PROTEIN: odorant receptor 10a [Drosophila arizonae]
MAIGINFRFLYGNQPLSTYFYGVPRLCLNLMGYWPERLHWRAYINFVVLAIGVATELHAGYRCARRGDITVALETFCPAGTSAVTLFKMFFLLQAREDLLYVLTKQRQMLFPIVGQTPVKEQVMRRHFLMTCRLNFWPVSAGFSTSSLYNLKPLMVVLLLYLNGRTDEIVWGMPFNMTMPEWLLHAPFYPLTFIFIAYTGYVTIFMFGGCDAFYFEFCVNIATLFDFLQADIHTLFQPYKGKAMQHSFALYQIKAPRLDLPEISGDNGAVFEATLVKLIKRQNEIFELTQYFRQRYATITLAHFVSASMVIGFSIFNLLTIGDKGLNTFLYVSYTVAALSQLLIYCYGGTLVTESSTKLAIVMGSAPWHLCLPKHRRYVHLFIMRSQRGLTMAVPFFTPSLVSFTTILQTSGSIIALAKSFQPQA